MIAEEKVSQLRVKKNCILAEGGAGTIFYATPTRARLLIDGGGAELVNVIGPTQVQVIGPSETKPAGPQEKKTSLTDSAAGQSTDFPASIESGKAPLSSSSAAALVAPKRNALSFLKRGPGRPRKSG